MLDIFIFDKIMKSYIQYVGYCMIIKFLDENNKVVKGFRYIVIVLFFVFIIICIYVKEL